MTKRFAVHACTHVQTFKSHSKTHIHTENKYGQVETKKKKRVNTLSERLRMIRERISQFKDNMMMNEPHKVNRQRSRDDVG
jgi:hypothetical protein